LTFGDIEDIWYNEVRVEDMACVVPVFGGNEPPAEDSKWRRHWETPTKQ